MPTKLYVGGLSFETTEQELKTFFEQAGPVQSANIVTDPSSGRSKGFGFVEMASDAGALKAITELSGKTLGDRIIRVEESRPSRSGGGPRSRGRPGGGSSFGRRPGGSYNQRGRRW